MRITVCSKLFAAVREEVWVSAVQQSCDGEQGGGVHAQFFASNSLSLLCSQKCVSPARDLRNLTHKGSECLEICLKDFVMRKPCCIAT